MANFRHGRLTQGLVCLVLAAALLTMPAATAGCTSGSKTVATSTPAGETPAPGGTLHVFLSEPLCIDPVNGMETEGCQVINAVFDSLLAYDYSTETLIPAAAERWEVNSDATEWTFYLDKNDEFHNGRTVTSADFKYAWERICDPANTSAVSYHLTPVEGYQAMQEGTATELSGLEVVDDYTLKVKLAYPFADFAYVVAHPTLAPMPREEVEKDPGAYAEKPVGNGPFAMAESWQHNQSIRLARFEGYYGAKAYVDAVDFRIMTDLNTAFLEFKAGNLDIAQIPTSEMRALQEEYGKSDDGLTAMPGRQVLLGPELASLYICLNTARPPFGNPDVRRAFSLALNREAMSETVSDGVQRPATGPVPEGVLGHLSNQWPYATFDREGAKDLLARAGFADGSELGAITLTFPSGAGNDDVMALVQADLQQIGVSVTLDGIEFATFIDRISAGDFAMAYLGWMADYPIMDNFLYSLFSTENENNYSSYSNPDVDQALLDARSTADTASRLAKYQEIERQIGEAAPIIPVLNSAHHHVASDRVRGLVLAPDLLLDLDKVWIAQ
jgi:oligopeptide transport system substrate-binding protein